MQDNSDLIIRDCCEAEVAEFGQPDTICITVDVLREIVQRHSPGPCLHQIQEPAKNKLLEAKPAFYTAIAEHDGDWIPLPEYSAQTSDGVLQRVLARAREEGYQGGNALDRLKELGWAYRPVYFAVDPAQVAPLPLLIRDIARELGITCAEACLALKPLGNFSTNTAVTAEMMAKLRERFPERVPASEVAGARERMTAGRACYFMERFLKEEKLLGPNEQAALHYVIDMLEAAAAPVVLPEPVGWRHSLTLTLHETEEEVQLADGDSHAQPLFTEQQVRALLAGVSAPAALAVERGEVLVTVSGFTGSGKSAIAGEIEIMCRALGLQVEWPDSDSEKHMTHADWIAALEQYKPRVRIVECNVPHSVVKGQDK